MATPSDIRVPSAPVRVLVAVILLLLIAGYLANALWNTLHLSHTDAPHLFAALTLPLPFLAAAAPQWAEFASAIAFLCLLALAFLALRAAIRPRSRISSASPTRDKSALFSISADEKQAAPPPRDPIPPTTAAPQEAPPERAHTTAPDLPGQSPYQPQPQPQPQSQPAAALSAPTPTPTAVAVATRVFISHTSDDNDFGEWLADRLKATGVDVWYDSLGTLTDDGGELSWKGGIQPADSWQAQIVAALGERSVFLVILSAKSVASRWVQTEIELAFSDKNSADPTRGKVIVPVLRETCDIPKLLATIQYVNFLPDRDQEDALAKVLYAVRRGSSIAMPPVTVGPPFDLALLPPLERFVGREHELDRVLALLTSMPDAGQDATSGQLAAVAATNGMGGIGKTALATEVVRRLMARNAFPDGIAVVICKDKRDPVELLKLALSRFTDGRSEPEEDTLPTLADRARDLLLTRRALIVLDNVEQDQMDEQNAIDWSIRKVIQPLRTAGAAVLVTSRAPIPAIPKEATVKLDVLPLNEALDLFALYFGRGAALDLTRAELADATTIVEALGRHSLAVKLAAANAATLNRPLDTMARELREHPKRALLLEDGEEAVRYVLASSLEALKPPARRFFALLAAFASADIGRQAALAVATAGLDELNKIEADAEAALKELIALRLVDPALVETQFAERSDRERLRLHPLLQTLAAEHFAAWDDSERGAARWLVAAWYAAYTRTTPDRALAPDEENIIAALAWLHERHPDESDDPDADDLIAAICHGMGNFWYLTSRTRAGREYLPWGIASAHRQARRSGERNDRLREAEITKTFGDILIQTGRNLQAEEALRQAQVIYQAIESRQGEANSLQSLGDVALSRGDLPAAEQYFQQALAIYQAIESRLGEANALQSLGDVALSRGDLPAAEQYFQQALPLYQAIEDRLGEANALQSLGDVALRRSDLPAAEQYFQQALAIYQAIESRQGEANSLQSLGDVALSRSDLPAAEQYYQQALPLYQAVESRLGEANSLRSLGDVALRRGDLPSAEQYYQQALPLYQAVEDRLGEANSLRSLGDVALRRSDLPAAEQYYQQALPLYQAVESRLGEANALKRLGDVALSRSDLPAAEQYYQQALPLYQAVESRLGEANSLRSLGDVALRRGDLPAAEQYYQQALPRFQATEDRLGEANSLRSLGDVALRRGDLPAAEQYYQQARVIFQAIESRQGEGNVLTSLGDVAQARGQLEAAATYYQQALAIDRALQDRNGERIDLSRLGDLEIARGHLDDAERYLTAALASAETFDSRVALTSALRRLADLLYQRAKHDEALALYQRILTLDPQNTLALAYIGNILDALDRHEEALAAYDGALTIDPSLAYVWRNKAGILLEDLRRYDAALAAAERSLQIEPDSIRGWSLKGLALQHLDREEEATAALEHALTLEPQSLTDWQSRGEALMALHRYEDALAAAEQALALDPNDNESLQRKAETLQALGHDHQQGMGENP